MGVVRLFEFPPMFSFILKNIVPKTPFPKSIRMVASKYIDAEVGISSSFPLLAFESSTYLAQSLSKELAAMIKSEPKGKLAIVDVRDDDFRVCNPSFCYTSV